MEHDLIDQRSLKLHRLAAEKIRQQPELLDFVRQKLNQSLNGSRLSESCKESLREWQTLLSVRSIEEILETMTAESDEGQRLRHSTPFSGLLTQPERLEILREHESSRI